MTTVTLVGAKGGVGTSLLASNLALRLAAAESCLLVDLAPIAGCADLLLGSEPSKSWADLLPVVEELEDRHLELATTQVNGGLSLLAAPAEAVEGDLKALLKTLDARSDWLIIDSGCAWLQQKFLDRAESEHICLVTTLDPVSLRAAERGLRAIQQLEKSVIHLVVNQWQPEHPVDPKSVAESMGIDLAAVLPFAPKVVADQVHFGRPALRSRNPSYGRAIQRLEQHLRQTTAPKPHMEA
ncbi:MAG: CpaE family protein [Anaerolineales bacterium]